MSILLPARQSNQPVFARRSSGLLSKIAPDRRRFKRVSVTLLGRFMRENRQEYPCRMVDISVSGAAMMSPLEIPLGERIVAQFDQLGGIEGTVVRQLPGGFALKLVATPHKREKLAAQLILLLNRSHLKDITERRHDRMKPANAMQNLTLTEGLTIPCQVVDFSLSGAFIATPARPEIGVEIRLGNVRCRVVRHRADGIGVQFVEVQHANALRKYFG